MKRWLPLVFVAALGVLLFVGVRMNAGKDNSAIESPLIGKPAPEFSLPRFDDLNAQLTQAELKGKPYLLNVFASWCIECQYEHPHITALAESGRIRVIGYNYKDERVDAERWLQQFGNPFESIVVDETGKSALNWGIYGAPETFLVDAQGIVRWKHIGALDEEKIRSELIPQIEALQ
jgi:cytochrome c biogenesis protein CcmG, thiol:disulfide interchange protein DsbE